MTAWSSSTATSSAPLPLFRTHAKSKAEEACVGRRWSTHGVREQAGRYLSSRKRDVVPGLPKRCDSYNGWRYSRYSRNTNFGLPLSRW
jgi:hypothetical protein